MSDRVGQRLDDYRLVRLLGTGSFGDVYLAEHVYRKQLVAIKVLLPLSDSDLPTFLNEARTIRLKHPHIVQVLDFGVDNKVPFIVMDYAPHGTLRQRHPKGTRVSLDMIVLYVKQAASALQYAHDERVIHRDVKPENLLVGSNNELLVSDFGIATVAHSSRSRGTQEMAGTIVYMAPEQVQGKPRFASDQYALGVIVYEWLCGERPFTGTPMEVATQHMLASPPLLHEKMPEILPDVEQVVMTALAKDPKDRFASVQAFANALEQAAPRQQPRPIARNTAVPSSPHVLPFVEQEKSSPVVKPLSPPSEHPVTSMPAPPVLPSTGSVPTSASIPGSTPVTASGAANTPRREILPSPNGKGIIGRPAGKGIRQRRFFYPILTLVALLLFASVGWGTYHWVSNTNIDGSLAQASMLISQASGEVKNNPVDALQQLANAQNILRDVQKNSLTVIQRIKLNDLLNGPLLTAVQRAMTQYNQTYNISVLPCTTTVAGAINLGSTNTQVESLASIVDGKGNLLSYALGGDHRLYQLSPLANNQHSLLNQLTSLGMVLKIAGNGSRLFALVEQPAAGGVPAKYSLHLLTPNGAGMLQDTSEFTLDAKLAQGTNIPVLITTWEADIYVMLTSSASQNTATILDVEVSLEHNVVVMKQVGSATISISTGVASVAAFPTHQLFLLLSDGSVQSLQGLGGNQKPESVLIQQPIAPSLPVSPKEFTPTVTVPTVSAVAPSQSFLSVSQAKLLVAGSIANVPYLYLVDGLYHRVLDLLSVSSSPASNTPAGSVTTATSTTGGATSSGGVMMQVLAQYTSARLLADVKSVVVNSKDAQLSLLTQSDQGALLSIDVSQKTPCGA